VRAPCPTRIYTHSSVGIAQLTLHVAPPPRPPNKENWQRLPGHSGDHSDWKLAVSPLLKRYAERTPGVMIEETEGSYTWNYRAAGPYGAFQAKDLHSIINSLIGTSHSCTKVPVITHPLTQFILSPTQHRRSWSWRCRTPTRPSK
jgi:hypothetical protein